MVMIQTAEPQSLLTDDQSALGLAPGKGKMFHYNKDDGFNINIALTLRLCSTDISMIRPSVRLPSRIYGICSHRQLECCYHVCSSPSKLLVWSPVLNL